MTKRKSKPRKPASRSKSSSRPRRTIGSKRATTRRGSGIKRTRPTVKSNARKSKVKSNPLPKAPPRRKTRSTHSGIRSQSAGSTSSRPRSTPSANNNLHMELSQIRSQFTRLEGAAQLPDIYDAIGEIDQHLIQLPIALETLRTRGYVHSGQIEDELEAIDDQWDEVRPRIENALQRHVQQLDQEMDQAERRLASLGNRLTNSNVRAAETAVEGIDQEIQAARTAVSGLYSGLDNSLDKIAWRIKQKSNMLDIIDDSPSIRMREAEAPLLVVDAEWQKDGDEGPDGILVLTDQRFMFEQREEVVTKRRFGLFKTESEMVQELQLEISVHDIESAKHKREGGFLGMGKEDILNLVCTASAPVSRAQFHIDGQRSEEWATMIKRIQTGDIDKDRADEYADEIDAADETAASFPEQCPTCFAAVPSQPRGITSFQCTFCSTMIVPHAEETADE